MDRISLTLGCVVTGVMLAGGSAAAQTAKLPEAPVDAGPATGFLVQARVQAQSSILSLGGGPGFLLGYRARSFALGLGVGWTRIGVSSEEGSKAAVQLSLLQIAPTVLVDVWHSADGRARANVVGSIGYGRASASASQDRQLCTYDPNTGVQTCRSVREEDSVGATLIPVTLGFGGDYFFARNFGLGLEAGFQGAFVTGMDRTSSDDAGGGSGTTSKDVDASANAQATYGMIRATLVLGD
jgi:opacity protein-like surface antigen